MQNKTQRTSRLMIDNGGPVLDFAYNNVPHYKYMATMPLYTIHTCLWQSHAPLTQHAKFAYIMGTRNGPRLNEASALTVNCHTSLCVHSHPQGKRKRKRMSTSPYSKPLRLLWLPRTRGGNDLVVSVCLSVCLSVCKSSSNLWQLWSIETSFLAWRYVIIMFRSSSYISVIASYQG